MICPTRRAAIACVCMPALLWGAVARLEAQSGGAGACRQGVLALIVMIDADEHDRSHYRSTATSVVETCGPSASAAKPGSTPVPYDKTACGKLALAMLDDIEANKMDRPEFVKSRDGFASQCLGK